LSLSPLESGLSKFGTTALMLLFEVGIPSTTSPKVSNIVSGRLTTIKLLPPATNRNESNH
jgi:hypothetical protein